MKQEIFNELKGLNSSLANVEKTDAYDVNEDYFDEMQKLVLSKVGDTKSEVKIIQLFSFRKIMSIAAAAIILIAATFIITQNIPDNKELANEDLYEYLIENVDDIDSEMFAIVINESDLLFEDEGSLFTDEINEYLENNIDDLTEDDLENLF